MNPTEQGPSDDTRRPDRLQALKSFESGSETIFDECMRLAASICGAPMALICLLDVDRPGFMWTVGLHASAEAWRDAPILVEASHGDGVLEVADAAQDARLAGHPMVAGQSRLRFFAGAPIAMPDGERVGALCVMDHEPRRLGDTQRTALGGLGRMVASALREREQRVAAVRELARTDAQYRTVVDGQSELVSLARTDGTLTYVNAAYAQFFGMTPEAMVGQDLLQFVAEHDRPGVQNHLRQVVDRGVAASGANWMVSAQGIERWVAWTNRTAPAPDGLGQVIHSVGRDVTAQRLAEQGREQAEHRYRMLYEATPAMLHSIDTAGRIIAVSEAWLNRLGFDRSEVLGRPSVDFLAPESQQRARREVLPAFFETGRCDKVPYQMVCRDGSVVDVLMSAVLERDTLGQPLRSLAVLQDVTELKVTAASLQESTHILQLVLDSVPARISYWDAASRNRFANRAFLMAYGMDQAAILGKHVEEVLGVDWYRRIQAPIERGLAGQPGRIEASFVPPGGSRRDVEMQFTPDLRDGQVHGLFVFAMDVTARREAERALADRERRFKLLIDGVRDYAIYMLDPEGRITTWNAGAEAIKGYRAAEVIGHHFGMFFTPADIAEGKPDHELAIATTEGRFEAEGWRVGAGGRRYWAAEQLSAIRDDRGSLVGYARIARDLTEQVQQKLLLDRAIEMAPCGMLMVDAAGQIVLANAQTETIFGYARAELLGQPLEKLIPARWREQHAQLREGFLQSPSIRAMGVGRELRALRRNGEEFPIEIGLSPIESTGGTATLATIFDITERRRQQALIEQALAEKETLLKEVYHRVKNNLQVVQSLLNLQSQTLPAGLARDAIDDSAQRVRAMALVHEKLYQSGNLSAVSLPVYIKDLMEQIAEALGTDRRKIRLHAQIADLHTGLDNAVPLGLLLTELITNCLKHAFEGRQGGDVTVSLVRQPDADVLTVADNGVGLPADFVSAAASSSMGLQLADGLARQLGGTLDARTERGAVLSARLSRL